MADLEIVVLPDPGAITFDEQGTPILTYTEWHADHGAGWILYYLDDFDGVEEYFIGGGLAAIDWATRQAENYLSRLRP